MTFSSIRTDQFVDPWQLAVEDFRKILQLLRDNSRRADAHSSTNANFSKLESEEV